MKPKVVKTDAEWHAVLTPEQYEVTRRKDTEQPFTGEYYSTKAPGVYACVCCGTELFRSETKFESGSGWPSFWAPLEEENIRFEEDSSHGMQRVEALCAVCDAHLGHVFPDGPPPTGVRFCINSLSLVHKKQP